MANKVHHGSFYYDVLTHVGFQIKQKELHLLIKGKHKSNMWIFSGHHL